MKVKIEINQIDNGFVVSLFDEDGPISHDQKLFVIHFAVALKKIAEWVNEAKKVEMESAET